MESAAAELYYPVSREILDRLKAGKIHGAALPDASEGGYGVRQTGDITLNRATWYGSTFEYGSPDLALILGHEFRHLVQLKGVPELTAREIHAQQRGALEADSNRFACENLTPDARSALGVTATACRY